MDDYIHSQMDGKYFDLDKIPLTDELILEFGFKKNESDGVVGVDTYEPEEKTIWYEREKIPRSSFLVTI